MPRFTPETEKYFGDIDRRLREIEQAKKRKASPSEPSPDEAPEISEPEIEIGALPVRRPEKKPEKKKETGPST